GRPEADALPFKGEGERGAVELARAAGPLEGAVRDDVAAVAGHRQHDEAERRLLQRRADDLVRPIAREERGVDEAEARLREGDGGGEGEGEGDEEEGAKRNHRATRGARKEPDGRRRSDSSPFGHLSVPECAG